MKRRNSVVPLIALFALAFIAPAAVAQESSSRNASRSVSGRVANAQTGAYLEGARVEIAGTGAVALTDRDGYFAFEGLPAGPVSVQVYYTGLDTATVRAEVSPDRPVVLDVSLVSSVHQMAAFQVSELLEGNAMAVTQQRNALNVKNVSALDAFGSLRDGNVAELLVLMPGVVGDLVGNDIRTVKIRGFDANLQSVTIDGSKLANAESGGLERNFEFDGLTADHIESVEVIKAPTPDMEADSIGGTVNMKTKSAFNFSGGRRITASAGVAFETKRNTIMPGGNLYYSEILGPKRNLGVSLNLGYSRHAVPRDGSAITYPTTTVEPNFIQLLRIFDQLNTRVRLGGGLRFDYKVNDRTTLFASGLFTSSNEQTAGGVPAHRIVVQSTAAGVAPGFTNDRVEYRAVAATRATMEVIHNPKGHGTIQWGGGFKHRWQSWKIDGDGTFSKDILHYDSPKYHTGSISPTFTGVGVILDRTNGHRSFPRLTQTSGPDIFDLASYGPAPFTQRVWAGWDKVASAQLNIARDFMLRYPVTLKFGTKYRSQVRTTDRGDRSYTYLGPDGVANSGDESLLRFADDYHNAMVEGRYPTVRWINTQAMAEALASHPTWFLEDPTVFATSKLTNNHWIAEDITSAYVMGQTRIGGLSLLAGVRYEGTEVEGKTNEHRITPEEAARRRVFVGTVTPAEAVRRLEAEYATRVGRGVEHSRVFPGVHLKYDLKRAMVLRASYSTSIGRPNFASIIPNTDVNDTTLIVTGNNIGLKPQFGQSFNVGAEYYFEPAGFVSISGFHTKISDFIFNSTLIIGTGNDNGFDGNYAGYTWRTQENGGDATIKGLELNYNQQLTFLPGVFKSFSVFGNYTRLKTNGNYGGTEAAPTTQLVGFVPESGNAGIAFTRFGLDVRVKATYKGEWLTAFSANAGAVRYTESRVNLDLNILYRFSRRYSVYFDWANILNAADGVDYQYKDTFVRTYNPTGSRFNFGFRAKL